MLILTGWATQSPLGVCSFLGLVAHHVLSFSAWPTPCGSLITLLRSFLVSCVHVFSSGARTLTCIPHYIEVPGGRLQYHIPRKFSQLWLLYYLEAWASRLAFFISHFLKKPTRSCLLDSSRSLTSLRGKRHLLQASYLMIWVWTLEPIF